MKFQKSIITSFFTNLILSKWILRVAINPIRNCWNILQSQTIISHPCCQFFMAEATRTLSWLQYPPIKRTLLIGVYVAPCLALDAPYIPHSNPKWLVTNGVIIFAVTGSNSKVYLMLMLPVLFIATEKLLSTVLWNIKYQLSQ